MFRWMWETVEGKTNKAKMAKIEGERTEEKEERV